MNSSTNLEMDEPTTIILLAVYNRKGNLEKNIEIKLRMNTSFGKLATLLRSKFDQTETLRLNVCPVVSPLGIYDAELDCLRLVKLFDDALDVFSVAVVPCSENIRFESRDSSLKLGLEKLRAETVLG